MDDLSGKISELFSDPDSMEKIRTLVNMLQNAGATPGPPPASEKKAESAANNTGIPNFDPAMLLNIQQAMNFIRKDDPRIDLLLALKPNLSDSRRKRVDEAIQIMRLMNLMPMLKEQGLLRGDG